MDYLGVESGGMANLNRFKKREKSQTSLFQHKFFHLSKRKPLEELKDNSSDKFYQGILLLNPLNNGLINLN